jgi:hypothetical protein
MDYSVKTKRLVSVQNHGTVAVFDSITRTYPLRRVPSWHVFLCNLGCEFYACLVWVVIQDTVTAINRQLWKLPYREVS